MTIYNSVYKYNKMFLIVSKIILRYETESFN